MGLFGRVRQPRGETRQFVTRSVLLIDGARWTVAIGFAKLSKGTLWIFNSYFLAFVCLLLPLRLVVYFAQSIERGPVGPFRRVSCSCCCCCRRHVAQPSLHRRTPVPACCYSTGPGRRLYR
jgi:hypothetical protein